MAVRSFGWGELEPQLGGLDCMTGGGQQGDQAVVAGQISLGLVGDMDLVSEVGFRGQSHTVSMRPNVDFV